MIQCAHKGATHMDCHHCGGCQKLISSKTYAPGEQFPWEHCEALWKCISCGKTEMVMNGIREPHPELYDYDV